MVHPSVKQERLGKGATSSEMERLSQRLREFDTEIAREMEQAKSRAEERRAPATDRMWPGATTDTQSQARPQATRRRCAKLPSFDGTKDWEAFHMQLSVLDKLCKWSEENKAQQLTTALRGEAQMVLVNLSEEEMGNYHNLVATLQCRLEAELLRARFRRRA
ncbi:UNVERIFIED_CONTAM: hypothetical protein FKN15_007813 [Acipenser sinensis]